MGVNLSWRLLDPIPFSLPSPPLPSSFPSLPSRLLPLLSSLPSLPLEVGTLNPARGVGSAVSSPTGVWGGAPAEIEFGAFYAKIVTPGGNNFTDFLANRVTKFRAV